MVQSSRGCAADHRQFIINGTAKVGHKGGTDHSVTLVACKEYCVADACEFASTATAFAAVDGFEFAQVGIYNSPGQLWEFELFDGDAGFAPRGSGHWILNTGSAMSLSHSVQSAPIASGIEMCKATANSLHSTTADDSRDLWIVLIFDSGILCMHEARCCRHHEHA